MDPAGEAALCVFCRRHPVQRPWRPFCSEGCRIQDLARWADGSYRVPVKDTDAPEGEFGIQNSEFRSETDE
jgi:endogenous inhibitor of DNA gyrase (YacG/DUF329 family)